MLDINFIRENIELIKKNCQIRNVKINLDKFLDLDQKRRELIQKIEVLRAKRNKKSKAKPSPEEIAKLKQVSQEIKELENQLTKIEEEFNYIYLSIPNLTHPETPIGGEEDFKVLKQSPQPSFSFQPFDHETLMTKLDLIDFERGAKVTGSKFYFFKNQAVLLNQALINYGLSIVSKYGYKFLETPDLVKNEILEGSGFNPRGEETQIYSLKEYDLSLIGTAEITTLGYHANEILDLAEKPLKYAALSHCFRTEAGAYGKASKGLYRVHQFTKLELFIFCEPDQSENLHQEILQIEEEIIKGLELPYRIIDVASGDLGGPAYRKFDVEVYMPFKQDYGEITSCSNCLDYQSRRLNIRCQNGKSFAHTLNGTAIVLSRFPLAIIENFQTNDGKIKIPTKLQPFLGFDYIG